MLTTIVILEQLLRFLDIWHGVCSLFHHGLEIANCYIPPTMDRKVMRLLEKGVAQTPRACPGQKERGRCGELLSPTLRTGVSDPFTMAHKLSCM